ncbi:hypothetical protein CsSME_00034932 [Camellia sinensis var. sinensis]
MGNEGLSKIIGMGDVCLETNLGCKLLLKDVRHVPDIRLNLISTGKLDDEGYNNKFGKICKGVVNALEEDTSTELWHKRLGHMSEKGLQVLFKKELLPGLKVRTHSGALYFVTFIDDYSRKVWAFLLKAKDQVLEVFKHFQAMVERETGQKLKCI